MSLATRVECRWDEQLGVEPGWYCQAWNDDDLVVDSMKVWFPFSVDEFGRDEADELVQALREAFPGAEVVME